jgi:hypothetical protein
MQRPQQQKTFRVGQTVCAGTSSAPSTFRCADAAASAQPPPSSKVIGAAASRSAALARCWSTYISGGGSDDGGSCAITCDMRALLHEQHTRQKKLDLSKEKERKSVIGVSANTI